MSIENPRQEASEPRAQIVDADQPDGIADDSYDLPDTSRAAARVNEFLAWYGDGRLYPCVLPGTEDEMPPLFARDLQALTNAALAAPDGAVKLGDVEAPRAEAQHWRSAYERLFAFGEERAKALEALSADFITVRDRAEKAARERDALRAEIRAVLDEWDTNAEATHRGGLEAVRAILERTETNG